MLKFGIVVPVDELNGMPIIDSQEMAEVTTPDGDLLLLSKIDAEWRVINAIDGYGYNCREKYKETKVVTI